jgi:outer membrane protein
LSSFIKAQDTLTLNLKQCIDLALKNNMDLLRTESYQDISQQRRDQSRAAFLPSINGYISQGENAGKSINPFTNQFVNRKIMTGQYGINASMNLWNGFNNYNTMRQNSFTYQANNMDYEQAKLDLIINVMTYYLQALSNEEIYSETLSQYELSQKQVDRLTILDNNKAVAPNVLYDAKGQLANDKLNLINAKNTLENSKLALAQLLNLNDASKIKLVKMDPGVEGNSDTKDALYQSALSKLPSVKASEYRMMSSKKNLRASQGSWLPSLSLYASLGSNYSDAASVQRYNYVSDEATDNYVVVGGVKTPLFIPQYDVTEEKINLPDQVKNNLNRYIGLNLQIPIFNSFNAKTQMSISKINYELMEKQNTANLNKLKINILQADLNYLSAKERYQTVQDQSFNYNRSFEIAVAKFDKGAITTVDYAYSKNNHDRANLNVIALKYDYYLKMKMLEYFRGEVKY